MHDAYPDVITAWQNFMEVVLFPLLWHFYSRLRSPDFVSWMLLWRYGWCLQIGTAEGNIENRFDAESCLEQYVRTLFIESYDLPLDRSSILTSEQGLWGKSDVAKRNEFATVGIGLGHRWKYYKSCARKVMRIFHGSGEMPQLSSARLTTHFCLGRARRVQMCEADEPGLLLAKVHLQLHSAHAAALVACTIIYGEV